MKTFNVQLFHVNAINNSKHTMIMWTDADPVDFMINLCTELNNAWAGSGLEVLGFTIE